MCANFALIKFMRRTHSFLKQTSASSAPEFKIKKYHEPFKGLSVLDIGCGGGLLSEPMARLGAEVIGIDASNKNIQVAKYHLKKSKLKIKYYNSSPENSSQHRIITSLHTWVDPMNPTT